MSASGVKRFMQLYAADGPFEMVMAYMGGICPGGREGSQQEVLWRQMRSWQAISTTWQQLFLEYNRSDPYEDPWANCEAMRPDPWAQDPPVQGPKLPR